MAPKRATRSTPSATTATTSATNAQLQAMIDQGVIAALAARDTNRSARMAMTAMSPSPWWNSHDICANDVAYSNATRQTEKKMTTSNNPMSLTRLRDMLGLPDTIPQGSVVASKPKTMQEAIEIATEPMDKKIHTFAKRQTENKRKQDDNHQQPQQQQNKRQNTG
ncbi:hypothetical protein Tco_0099262 [Tanacetum coccineum]